LMMAAATTAAHLLVNLLARQEHGRGCPPQVRQ
jgi:hypothetical protein